VIVAPADYVRGFADQMLATIGTAGGAGAAERLGRVDDLVAEHFDLDRISRIALGRYWKTATEGERQEFARLFKDYVLISYGRRFDRYTQRYRLRAAADTPAGEDGAMVESYLEGGANPIRIDWRLAQDGPSWRVLDVTVEGVSLLMTYRNEFATIIERGGGRVAALLGELRTRVAAERDQLAG
jgi:phospholipid transport system substrate-binding protein